VSFVNCKQLYLESLRSTQLVRIIKQCPSSNEHVPPWGTETNRRAWSDAAARHSDYFHCHAKFSVYRSKFSVLHPEHLPVGSIQLVCNVKLGLVAFAIVYRLVNILKSQHYSHVSCEFSNELTFENLNRGTLPLPSCKTWYTKDSGIVIVSIYIYIYIYMYVCIYIHIYTYI